MSKTVRSTRRARAAAALAAVGVLASVAPMLGASPAGAVAVPVIISEVWPGGSSNGTYGADWFEITNTSGADLPIGGWKVDDSSNAIGSALALNGVTTIPAGASAVFVEGDATKAAALQTAWFGTEVPSGFLIGTYSGSGIGLGGSGDAVNLFDGAGAPVTGVTFGAAGVATTFDNAAGLTGAISTLSAVGSNGGFVSANGAETGSPGTVTNPPTLSGVDLSAYVRVGRYDLPEPTTVTPPDAVSLLAQEVSAVTYNPVTDSLFVVGDGGTSITQVSKTGELIDSMTLAAGSSPQGTEFYDTEGLTYVGGGDQFVFAEERDRQVSQFTYVAGTTLERADVETVDLGTFEDNTGIEGLTYDPLTGGFVAVKEIAPEGIFQTDVDFANGTASNGSASTVNSTNLFDPALLGLSDFADVYALSNIPAFDGLDVEGDLLVLSQEQGRIVATDRTGAVSSSLTIATDPGNPLTVPNQQHEGLTMDHEGNLYVVSENGGGSIDDPQLWVYAPSDTPNQAPTAVDLTNQTTSLAENTSTATRLRVADVAVTDDGLGTNQLSVVGPDAASFEVDSNGLYVKAGTVLDFEAQETYTVSVEVDDPDVGSAPDATSTPFVLTLTDVADETVTLPPVVISEVSPWSSSGSSYTADWFEITNLGGEPVDLTGWTMDDNSNDFASSVALAGVSALAPGCSAVFLEGNSTKVTAFEASWFGASVPSGLAIGTYSGGGVGLSTGGDSVNLFTSAGDRITGVSFGISTTGRTFDNTDGIGSASLPLPAITELSTPGTNGAFVAAAAAETGSPGTKATTLIISEVSPWSSGNSPYAADWFEVTNTGAAAVDISGWKMDDSSGSPVGAAPLTGVTAIAAGSSAVFIEGDATKPPAFATAWFGAAGAGALPIGSYTGSGVGLGTGGDAVNLFDGSGTRVTAVDFGGSTTGFTFDNAAGLTGTISTLSVVGTNGAFLAADGIETGSPGRIVNPPVVPAVVPGTGTGTETSGSTAVIEVPVTLSEPTTVAVSVEWATVFVPGAPATQAEAPSDYTTASGTVTFAPGETAKTVAVTIQDDATVEPIEYFVVSFRNPTGAVLGGYYGLGFGRITDDDQPSVLPGSASVVEGNSGTVALAVPVTLSTPSTGTVTVDWATTFAPGAPAGQASAANDYTAASGTVTFAPGETSKTVTILVKGDTRVEPNEYIVVAFGNATNAVMGGFWGLGFGVITTDD